MFLKNIDLTTVLVPLFVFIVLAAAAAIFALLFKPQFRYRKKSYLMTRSENVFFKVLLQAANNDYHIFSKVRIADVLTPDIPQGNKKWWRAFVRISSKHVDFVLCDKRSQKIVLCIELDDRSHDKADRKQRDGFVNHAFKSAGLPLLRIPTAKSYDPHYLAETIATTLNQTS